MRMPRKVVIGKTTYTIGRNRSRADAGSFDASGKPNIRVSTAFPAGNIPATLIHEILHAGQWEYAVPLNEKGLDLMAHIFIDLVRHNPKLVAYLSEAKGDKA